MGVSFRQGMGASIRAARHRHGMTADELASQAQEHGLAWQRATVSMIESGKRGLRAEEMLLLPLLFLGKVTLLELMREPMQLTSTIEATPKGFAEVLRGEPPTFGLEGEGFREPSPFPPLLDRFLEKLRSDAAFERDLAVAAAEMGDDPHPAPTLFRRVLFGPQGAPSRALVGGGVERSTSGRHREPEWKAARSLGVHADQLARAAWLLFGRGFTEERDARVAQREDVGADAARLRAARRRASLELLAEIRRFTVPPHSAGAKES
jgi:transcriptional regulator with XRE-family HTH domain